MVVPDLSTIRTTEILIRVDDRKPCYQSRKNPRSNPKSNPRSNGQIPNTNRLPSPRIEKQISLLAKTIGRLESQVELLSQTKLDSEENASVIPSETIIEPPLLEHKEAKTPTNPDSQEGDDATTKEGSATPEPEASPYAATTKEGSPTPEPEASPYVAQPPFPVWFIEEDKRAKEEENLDVSRKGEVYIPHLEVSREMPRYAHFLKEPCANTIKFSGQAKVNLGKHISMVLTQWFPPKIKDQDMVAITRKIHKISLKEVLSWTKLQCL
ncbi:hypothetical protein V6N11_044922 [Hibiscus sabdariffa]|uniref:Uncharacterized protein n=1 Tax=Hibiscus sabdariffa TaxID=183260 RepID=A0ABR2PU94_9ROSI